MKTLTVALGDRSYPIYLGEGILDRLPAILGDRSVGGSAAIVTDSNVGPLYAERVASLFDARPVICAFEAGEERKRLDQIEWLCGRFLEAGLDRGSMVVALGGGVVGDMAGFAAAVYMRGIRFIQIPTTIVAQVDSSVGGKTGVNHPLGKNSIGSFHQPSAVIIDMSLLATLPDREVRAGMAEVIKHGVIADADLFAYLEGASAAILAKDVRALERPILRSCEIKSEIVAMDEREQGRRAELNYGHTFGHAIEAASEYSLFLHGEAVALGMHAAGVLAHSLGMVEAGFVSRQRACIEAYGLPVAWPDLPVEAALAAMRHDKKVRSGAVKLILPDRMGHVVQRTDIDDALVRKAFEALRG
ncbi:MAG TPA: 3-dehydroquinate synthase [Candidatus Hydrogenedentes bacterium]|nr:3-dehydroquinate synthase [Candidatus Hydrogenedentota bacterium]HOT49640.1 3-dehydroquinate synthase [Candidatus Hydrogenedentota bacterium]HOV74081.1 3-dehydroquinate synthase [Candidatus Hydrogenedentota bacterium]HPC15933.1 3-dehydroquinate synthase [Candidatus Hydrogenedentota bacterium]HRT19887.1 3-dehydroquinate synthase [Candidatus Hydrogenedentota bacterium]